MTLHGGTDEPSPPVLTAPYLHSLSRSVFVFCFERDLHDLISLPFQKVEMLRLKNFKETYRILSVLSTQPGGLS